MTDNKNYEPPEQDPKDAAYMAGRALLSLIPAVGGIAVEVFQFIVTPPIEKRRNEWMKEIGQAIKNLENEQGISLETLKSDDVFVDTLLQASQIALRNSQQEKLNALKNAVINSALPEPPNQSLQQMFLNWVDAFTVWHIRVLQLFHNPPQWAKENNHQFPTNISMGRMDDILASAFPELARDRALYDQIWNDLYQKGLVNTPGLHTTMSRQGMISSRTTDLGSKFLSFINKHE